MTRHLLPAATRPKALATPRPAAARPLAVEVAGGEATVRLYEEIDATGWWGTSAQAFAKAIDALGPVERIHLRINSPGGDVFDGITIANTLRAHPAAVTVTVDGLAASIASVIALSGDQLVMGPNSEMMIHNAWGITAGDADDVRKFADLLDHLSDNIASAYAAKAGGATTDWRALMAAETWYSAQGALDAGLADQLAEGKTTTSTATTSEAAQPAAGLARAQAALIRAKMRRAS